MKRLNVITLTVMMALSAGALVQREVPTSHVPSPGKVSVIVPDSYETDSVSYPVVYLLNGHGGGNMSWSYVINLDSLATVYKTIIVCPDGLNSWYWNSPVDSTLQMEDYITMDLIPWVDANYRTRADRCGRAITGLSMGGHGGLWLGLRHPELFANAGSTSGGVDIRPFPEKWNMALRLGEYKDNPDVWDSHTVINLVPEIVPGRVNIIFDCGTGDFFYEVNNNLHHALKAKGIPHTYLTSPGVHDSNYWRRSIVPQMQFFHSHFYCD